MKGQKTLHSSKSDNYGTPSWVFDPLNNLYRFTLDPCATKENAKCKRFFTKETDGLSQSWAGERVFMNPPYSEVDKWMSKAMNEVKNPYTLVVALTAARTDTRWFQDFWWREAEGSHSDYHYDVWFIKGRIKFIGGDHPAPFPSALIAIGNGRWPKLSGVVPYLVPPIITKLKTNKDQLSHQKVSPANSDEEMREGLPD